MYFSKQTGGFYSKTIHGDSIPKDAKHEDEWQVSYSALIEGQSQGKIIKSDLQGFPTLAEKPLQSESEIKSYTLQRVAEKRYSKEGAGIVWNGYIISTDRGSQSKLETEDRAVERGLRVEGSGWKCFSVEDNKILFRPTTNMEIQAIAISVYNYVSACFRREAVLIEAVDAGIFTEDMLDSGWPSAVVD